MRVFSASDYGQRVKTRPARKNNSVSRIAPSYQKKQVPYMRSPRCIMCVGFEAWVRERADYSLREALVAPYK